MLEQRNPVCKRFEDPHNKFLPSVINYKGNMSLFYFFLYLIFNSSNILFAGTVIFVTATAFRIFDYCNWVQFDNIQRVIKLIQLRLDYFARNGWLTTYKRIYERNVSLFSTNITNLKNKCKKYYIYNLELRNGASKKR